MQQNLSKVTRIGLGQRGLSTTSLQAQKDKNLLINPTFVFDVRNILDKE